MTNKFIRTEMLLGSDAMEKLKHSTVAVFGVGGVGSFVVEALARCGIGRLVLVDFDDISESNINRQLLATHSTVGKVKVEVMKERVLDINPDTEVHIYKERYTSETGDLLLSKEYSYVVDAIDIVTSKIDLIQRTIKLDIPIISSMGAGNKINPTMLQVTDIYKTSMDPLARVMRRELKKRGIKKLKVVYSKEQPLEPKIFIEDSKELKGGNRQPPGSISFVPSVAGLIIASEVVKDLIDLK